MPGRAEAGHGRHAVRGDVRLGADLVAHHVERALPRADEDDPGVGAGAREAPRSRRGSRSPGWIASRAGLAGGGDHRVDVEIRRGCRGRPDPHRDVGLAHVRRVGVGVAVDGDRADAEPPQRADHAACDLAAVGDEHGVEDGVGGLIEDRSRDHIRKTPKRGSGSGVRETTSSASPSRSRVSAGRRRRRPRAGRSRSTGCPAPRTARGSAPRTRPASSARPLLAAGLELVALDGREHRRGLRSRPSPRCGSRARSTGTAASTRGRTSSSCRRRTSRR